MMDELKIDAAFTTGQKGLGGIVGLAPIALSERALYVFALIKILFKRIFLIIFAADTYRSERIMKRTKPPRGYDTDFLNTVRKWNATNLVDPKNSSIRYPHMSFSLSAIYSLRESLAFIAEEGIQNTFDRHVKATKQLHRGMESLGLQHFVKDPKNRMVAVSTFHVPVGKDLKKLIKYIFDR